MPGRKLAIILAAGLALFAIAAAAAGIFLCEVTLHPYVQPTPGEQASDSRALPVSISAPDGLRLRAWYKTPQASNGGCVVLLHGVSDTHRGVAGIAEFLVDSGYGALMPDSRGHGASIPSIATYGLREAYDVRNWVDWLAMQRGCNRIYGFGTSMGGAILLESLAVETRFHAVVADSPFAAFSSIASYRVDQRLPFPPAIANLVSAPVLFSAFTYGRLRYGLDLVKISPLIAVKQTTVPVLLIHGTADTNIPVSESRRIHASNPKYVRLWTVEGAGHTGSFGAQPDEYRRRVLAWFGKS
jgi:alpha-beta hydrolase superfamily lysophospholipase